MLRLSELRPRWRSAGLFLATAAGLAGCEIDQRDVRQSPVACVGHKTCAETDETAAGAGGTGQDPLGVAGTSGAGGSAAGGMGGAGGSGQTGVGGGAGVAGSGAGAGSAGSAGMGSNPAACASELLSNGGFEAGLAPWVAYTTGQDPLDYDAAASADVGVIPYEGQRLGWLGGVPSETNRLSQEVTLPADAARVAFRGALRIQLFEQHTLVDFLRGTLVVAGQRIPLFVFDNGDVNEDWLGLAPPAVDVTAYAGQTLMLEIESDLGVGPGTNFFLDAISLVSECAQ